MIELQDVCWSTPEGRQILDHINLKLRDNRLTAISGPNGGGKTTLARILMGMDQPSSGKILLDGQDITGLDVTERASRGLCFAFQQPVSFKGISVKRMLELASGHPVTRESLCTILQQVGLCAKDYIDRDIDSTLSGGEMKRIEIATVLARNTQYVVLDEPEAGIDLWSFEKLISIFKNMKDSQKKTLIVISHQERILQISDEIVIIAEGKVTDHGPGPEMLSKLLQNNRWITHCCGAREVQYESYIK